MKKLLLTVLSLAIVALSSFALYACGTKEPEKVSGTEGLAYALGDDGLSYICTGTGTSAETEISIASWYNGKWVTGIGENAFNQNASLKSVVIPEGIKVIGDYAFYDCSSLQSMEFPDGLTEIGNYAFRGCISLESVSFPASVKLVGDSAFKDCIKIKSVNIPGNGSAEIADYAFESCERLESVTIGGGVRCVGDAFFACAALKDINLSDNVTKIGSFAFYGTAYYNNAANWSDGVLYIGNHLIKADPVKFTATSYTVKGGTRTVAEEAFSACHSLKSLTLPDSAVSLGGGAFGSCTGLTSINIPEKVTYIGESAFAFCTALQSATFEKTDKWTVTSAFDGKSEQLSASGLSDAGSAAQLLVSTYATYAWERG